MNRIDLPPGKPNLEVFAQTLAELAEQERDLLVATSDARGSGRLTAFGEKYPEQLVELGIAEQNLVGVAAGLAAMEKKVFAVSPACFLTARAFEQIKNDVAYSNWPVKLVGISAGVSYGALGSTHHALHDFAALQAIHNLDIVAPADNFETRQAVQSALRHPHPVYLRFGKKAMPDLPSLDGCFKIGKARVLTPEQERCDIAFVATGECVAPAFQASLLLAEQGVTSSVLSVHSIRPFDETAIGQAAERARAVITVEEHSVYGGLGSRTAAFLMQARIFRRLRIVGIPDEPTITGSQEEIFRHYGISAEGLRQAALDVLN